MYHFKIVSLKTCKYTLIYFSPNSNDLSNIEDNESNKIYKIFDDLNDSHKWLLYYISINKVYLVYND